MKFTELLNKEKVLLFDGGMGTQLAERGCEMGGAANLSSPEDVVNIHRDYSEAGADVIISNTFTMNRINIESHKLAIDVKEVNIEGAKLARQAVGQEKMVFGDIGPTGQLLKPFGSYSEEEMYESFFEQVQYLVAEKVDGLIIESFTDLKEAVCALKACRDVATGVPVILSMAFKTVDKGGRTIMGSTVAGVAEAASAYGAVAVGANCGDLDPMEMAELVSIFKKETNLPLMVQPNAGKPKFVDGKTTFDMKPEQYADGVIKCIENGASIVGGCCGTTPDHIKALSENLR